jgi:ferredoxin
MNGARFLADSPAALVTALRQRGWRVVAPVERDGAIRYAPVTDAAEMPRGRRDEQEAGHYRLVDGEPGRWFDYVVGPESWKPWLFPPKRRLWSAERTGEGFAIEPEPDDWPPTAFLGVRPCEIAAIRVQDRVFAEGAHVDPVYARRRAETLIVAVQCARAAPTCFCASMETGPRAEEGFDLALTELDGCFLLETGSGRGAEIAESLGLPPAREADEAEAAAQSARAAASQSRTMPGNVAGALACAPEHPRWDDVAARCLGCANCTLACPTCFCSDVEDVTDLTGDHAERWLVWDSCFGLDFSVAGPGPVRRSTRSRYRQWLTHKLSAWHEQFGSSGCVGCGRCITWCPVGIDLTREAAAIAGGEPGEAA